MGSSNKSVSFSGKRIDDADNKEVKEEQQPTQEPLQVDLSGLFIPFPAVHPAHSLPYQFINLLMVLCLCTGFIFWGYFFNIFAFFDLQILANLSRQLKCYFSQVFSFHKVL